MFDGNNKSDSRLQILKTCKLWNGGISGHTVIRLSRTHNCQIPLTLSSVLDYLSGILMNFENYNENVTLLQNLQVMLPFYGFVGCSESALTFSDLLCPRAGFLINQSEGREDKLLILLFFSPFFSCAPPFTNSCLLSVSHLALLCVSFLSARLSSDVGD